MVIPCGSQSLIERQFQSEYTHDKFQEIQVEFRGKMNCFTDKVFVEGQTCRYDVVEEAIKNGEPEHNYFVVGFNRSNLNINCSCMLSEFRRIVCRHSLLVFAQERVNKAPKKYVLSRWSKNVHRKHTYIRASYGTKDKEPHIERYDSLCQRFYETAECACESDDTTKLLFQYINDFASILTQKKSNSRKEKKSTHNVVSEVVPTSNSPLPNTENSSIRSLKVVNRKGRPRSSRFRSRCEVGGRPNRRANATTVETTQPQVTSLVVDVANEVQMNTTISNYDGFNRLDYLSNVLVVCFFKSQNGSSSLTFFLPIQVSHMAGVSFMSLLNSVYTNAHERGN